MDRQYYLDLAASGLSMPIGADLVLHEHADAEAILLDGERLGKVLEETAELFATPLAVPRMDLELERRLLMDAMGVLNGASAAFHFDSAPERDVCERVRERLAVSMGAAMRAQLEAIQYVSDCTSLVPVGMAIGPFSLMTKLVSDPITPVCMAGAGIGPDEDEGVRLIEGVLNLGMEVILHSVERQIEAGAKVIFVAEPAANKVYLSPNQIDSGSDVFERYVTAYNGRIKALLEAHDVDLFFHCCGELTDYMVRQFAKLDPAILSLGSSRTLWEDAALVPKNIVLYGNLPSKRFYSDELVPLEQIGERGSELLEKMEEASHPFILGSECDVLSVPGCHEALMGKAKALARCRRDTVCRH